MMGFAVRQNGVLHSLDKLADRLLFRAGDLVECEMADLLRIADCQRAREVVFGNLIDAGDHMNSHPGPHSTDIARFDRTVALLEITHRLTGTDSREADEPQH